MEIIKIYILSGMAFWAFFLALPSRLWAERIEKRDLPQIKPIAMVIAIMFMVLVWPAVLFWALFSGIDEVRKS